MRVLAPSSAQELQVMMADAADLAEDGPIAIRYPRGRARQVGELEVGSGLNARQIRHADDPAASVCVIAIGKLVAAAERAADDLAAAGIDDGALVALHRAGQVVRLAPGVVVLPDAPELAVQRLAALPQPFTTSQARQALETSRRVALPLLAHLDATRRTVRLADDTRRLTRPAG
jgi:hypothetical protein